MLRDGAALIALGILIGLPLSLAAGRISTPLPYGVRPNDPATLASATALLAALGVFAAFVPAHRAASVAPVEALRHE